MGSGFDLLFAVGFLALGIALRMGKCADLVLGKDPEMRARYNEAECLKYFSTLLLVLSACDWMCVIAAKIGNNTLFTIGIGLNMVIMIAGITYFVKSKRFRK